MQQGAADAINVIRKRANAPEITAKDATIDFLLDERIRELVGEELRRFTLVRTGKLVERVKKYNRTATLWMNITPCGRSRRPSSTLTQEPNFHRIRDTKH